MTICPAYHDAYNKTYINSFNSTVSQIRKGQYPNGISSSMDFFNKITVTFDNLVESILVETLASQPSTTFRKFLFKTDTSSDNNGTVYSRLLS